MHENSYHHEEVVEIMVSPPGWGLKWGNMIIGFIVLIIFGFAYFFSYPDTLKVPIDLSATTSVIAIKPPAVNYGIETFLVKNGAGVKRGEPLLVWYDQYQSSFGEISKLEQVVLNYKSEARPVDLKNIDEHQLGALRDDYRLLMRSPVINRQQIESTLSAIADWKAQYITKATAAGTVTLNTLVSQIATPVEKEKPILYIQPLNAHYVAHGLVSNKYYGSLKAGVPAYVSINDLNNKKIQGHVMGVSPLANQAKHDIYIKLDQMPGLNLTFTGDATIILHNRTLLQRLFNINN